MSSIAIFLFFGCLVSICVSVDQQTPQQLHISFTGKQREISVQWVTFSPSLSPVVLCSNSSTTVPMEVCGKATTAHYPNITGWEGYVYTAILSSLIPSQTYYYRVGDDDQHIFSDTYTFRGPRFPVCGDLDQSIRVAVFGDMDISSDSDETVSNMTAERDLFDFFLHMGDIAYTSTSSHIQVNDTRLDEYFGKIEPFASHTPYIVSPGNQEQYYRFWQHKNRWYTPPGPNGVQNLWYSFDYGCAHFVSISTEHDMLEGSEQYQWLEQDLAKASTAEQRAQIPFIILYGHRPIYCTNTPLNQGYFEDCFLTGPALRTSLEPLIRKYSVDLYMAGHMHGAEMMYPLRNGKVLQTNWIDPPPNSVTQVVSGYAGCRENFNAFDDNFTKDWTAFRDATHYGYAHLSIVNGSYLELTYFFNGESQVQYDVVFTRGERRNGAAVGDELYDEKEEIENGGITTSIPEDVFDFLPFNGSFLKDPQKLSPLVTLPPNMVTFGVGIFIGLGDICGNIHSDVANWEIGISYDIFWCKMLWDRAIADPTPQNIEEAMNMTMLFKQDLKRLVHESGGPRCLRDFYELAKYYEVNGKEDFLALETSKFLLHEKSIRRWYQNAEIFLQDGIYRSAGIEYGRILGVLLIPLPK